MSRQGDLTGRPIIETERLRLRQWAPADLDAFAAMNADPEVMRYSGGPLTRDESAAFIARAEEGIARHGFGFWAAEMSATRTFIGYVGLNMPTFTAPFTPCVEIGWRLARAHWNKGYATEAAKACLDFGFGRAGLTEILAWTVPDNHRSRRVMDRIGMRRDPAEDFEHPNLPAGHPLRPHVLYRIAKPIAGSS